MRTPALIFSFVLTFAIGAAVGAWTLWIYMMGGGALPSAGAPAAPETSELPVEHLSPPAEQAAPAAGGAAEPEDKLQAEPATPTPKGHWSTVETPGRSREECLKLSHGVLNDQYKDCRFGTRKQVWVDESAESAAKPEH